MNVEELFAKIEGADEDELKDLKLWLFREGIRISNEAAELEGKKTIFAREFEEAKEENRKYEEHLSTRAKQIRANEELIEKKFEAIKRGFDELDRDRRALNTREAAIHQKESQIADNLRYGMASECEEFGDALFTGADNIILLKKRYKDLMKMYHPDCLGGDTEMMKTINKAYDRQVKEYERYSNTGRRRA